MLTSDVSSEYSCVKMSQASGPTSKVYERYRRIILFFLNSKQWTFAMLILSFWDEIQEIKKAKWNGYKTNTSYVIVLRR